jgi:hypothetical protein
MPLNKSPMPMILANSCVDWQSFYLSNAFRDEFKRKRIRYGQKRSENKGLSRNKRKHFFLALA